MESSAQTSTSQRIDLLRSADVAYWCRIFGVSVDQLREAVRHAGHHPAEVHRYIVSRSQPQS